MGDGLWAGGWRRSMDMPMRSRCLTPTNFLGSDIHQCPRCLTPSIKQAPIALQVSDTDQFSRVRHRPAPSVSDTTPHTHIPDTILARMARRAPDGTVKPGFAPPPPATSSEGTPPPQMPHAI